jgi:hypothetical protein
VEFVSDAVVRLISVMGKYLVCGRLCAIETNRGEPEVC